MQELRRVGAHDHLVHHGPGSASRPSITVGRSWSENSPLTSARTCAEESKRRCGASSAGAPSRRTAARSDAVALSTRFTCGKRGESPGGTQGRSGCCHSHCRCATPADPKDSYSPRTPETRTASAARPPPRPSPNRRSARPATQSPTDRPTAGRTSHRTETNQHATPDSP